MIYGYYKKEFQKKSLDFIKKYSLVLWSFPFLISLYLFLSSPNIIEEIKGDVKDEAKIENIKIALDKLKSKSGGTAFASSAYPKDKPTTTTVATSIYNTVNESANNSTREYVNEEDKIEGFNNVHLYLFEFKNDKAGLVRIGNKVRVLDNPNKGSKIEQGDEQSNYDKDKNVTKPVLIRGIIQKLINPPNIYKNRYQSLIPTGTKLISLRLDEKGNLLLNFNEEFLNNYYGEEGSKLKIAQIVSTLTELPYVVFVSFHINGKKVNYLDREGLIANNRSSIKSVVSESFAKYVH